MAVIYFTYCLINQFIVVFQLDYVAETLTALAVPLVIVVGLSS
ncbi:hypothetical protein [Sutcliffiella rhizosphaerae]|nr:hypothetical protein [Sutcliffiella rhizosphaerae]